jgi:hypothetical protein
VDYCAESTDASESHAQTSRTDGPVIITDTRNHRGTARRRF